MDEQPDRDDIEFAASLRRLQPTVGRLSAEETFYQAGWNAARRVSPPTSQREIRGFAVGMVCGLLCCAVGVRAWMLSAERAERQIVEQQDAVSDTVPQARDDHAGESSVVSDVPGEVTGRGLHEILALVRPGQWLPGTQVSQQSLWTAGRVTGPVRGIKVDGLRRLAESTARLTDSERGMTADAAPEAPRGRLRAFPLLPDDLDEWL